MGTTLYSFFIDFIQGMCACFIFIVVSTVVGSFIFRFGKPAPAFISGALVILSLALIFLIAWLIP